MAKRMVTAVGAALSALVSALAYWGRALTIGGALAAWVVGTVVVGTTRWAWGGLLLLFFVTSSLLSFLRKADKEKLAAGGKGARRDAGQVFANGGAAALAAGVALFAPVPAIFAAYCGSLAAATADTWATELGATFGGSPRLITNGRPVPAGTSGGVTPAGTLGGAAGAALIALAAMGVAQLGPTATASGVRVAPEKLFVAVLVGGFAGMLVDSLVGATLQGKFVCDACGVSTESRLHVCGKAARRVQGWAWLGNDWVNVTATFVGAGLGYAVFLWL